MSKKFTLPAAIALAAVMLTVPAAMGQTCPRFDPAHPENYPWRDGAVWQQLPNRIGQKTTWEVCDPTAEKYRNGEKAMHRVCVPWIMTGGPGGSHYLSVPLSACGGQNGMYGGGK
jgi:hypothetical protein